VKKGRKKRSNGSQDRRVCPDGRRSVFAQDVAEKANQTDKKKGHQVSTISEWKPILISHNSLVRFAVLNINSEPRGGLAAGEEISGKGTDGPCLNRWRQSNCAEIWSCDQPLVAHFQPRPCPACYKSSQIKQQGLPCVYSLEKSTVTCQYSLPLLDPCSSYQSQPRTIVLRFLVDQTGHKRHKDPHCCELPVLCRMIKY